MKRVFVAGHKRIGDEMIVEQVGVDASGNGGRMPLILVFELPIGELEHLARRVATGSEEEDEDEIE